MPDDYILVNRDRVYNKRIVQRSLSVDSTEWIVRLIWGAAQARENMQASLLVQFKHFIVFFRRAESTAGVNRLFPFACHSFDFVSTLSRILNGLEWIDTCSSAYSPYQNDCFVLHLKYCTRSASSSRRDEETSWFWLDSNKNLSVWHGILRPPLDILTLFQFEFSNDDLTLTPSSGKKWNDNDLAKLVFISLHHSPSPMRCKTPNVNVHNMWFS